MARYMAFNIVCIIINEHEFISDFVVVVNSITILADIIFINFILLSLTYQLTTYLTFYWDNNITAKYLLDQTTTF